MIPVIDWHCDVLYKLEKHPEWSFIDSDNLDVTYTKLKQGGVKVQAFAIFVEPSIEDKFENAKRQIERFKTHVLTTPQIVHIKHFSEIQHLKEDQIGAFLTLEGLDCVGDDLKKVQYFLDEGILSVGFTWNNANLACDGIMEPRGAGLTQFGFNVVDKLNQHDVFVDVSHISERGFDDVLNTAKHVIASHSNTRTIHNHVRNLTDHQLNRLRTKGAPIHLVYLDWFITEKKTCEIADLLKHFEYLINLGFKDQLGLGSDFDGIQSKIVNLEDASQTQNLLLALKTQFGEDVAEGIAYKNFMRYVDCLL